MSRPDRFLSVGRLCLVLVVGLVMSSWQGGEVAAGLPPHLGYGFNVAEWDLDLLTGMGFDWIKVFNAPGDRLPVNVLVRVEANSSHLNDLGGFASSVSQLAQNSGAYIEAYEIGNEVNLDASYGWTTSPVAEDYVALLCVAYAEIKAADPDSVVVSAGLAPTGRVTGDWNGHSGHNGLYQDERAFLREFLAAGGGECADVIGYHPYGFSADYDAEPDVASGDSTQNCANGFCFRGTEKFYEVMTEEGYGNKQVWATEFGWIIRPPDECLSDPGFQGREWQLVTEAQQAENLRGAFEYADVNWGWMGTMVIFNLNFNTADWYPLCEQMRYYGVEGRPAEGALRDMVKRPGSLTAEIGTHTSEIALMWDVASQPASQMVAVTLVNSGWVSTDFSATIDPAGTLSAVVVGGDGTIDPAGTATFYVDVSSDGQPVGTYETTLHIDATSGTGGVPLEIPVSLRLIEGVQFSFLPISINR